MFNLKRHADEQLCTMVRDLFNLHGAIGAALLIEAAGGDKPTERTLRRWRQGQAPKNNGMADAVQEAWCRQFTDDSELLRRLWIRDQPEPTTKAGHNEATHKNHRIEDPHMRRLRTHET